MKYYRNGKLYDGTPTSPELSSQHRAYDHAKQRREHSADLVQPWASDGTLSREFAWLYPEEARQYHKS